MKNLTTLLLIVLIMVCFGCKESGEKRYFLVSYNIRNEIIGTFHSSGGVLKPRVYYRDVIYNMYKCDGVGKDEILINGVYEFEDSVEWNSWMPANAKTLPDTCIPKTPILFSIEDTGYLTAPKPSPLPDTTKPIKDSGLIDWSNMEIRCGVSHCTEDGCFSCDYHGHYYPFIIYNDSIRKWFVKMDGNDSIFYYRHKDDTMNYIWDGRYYTIDYGDGISSSLVMPRSGSDTFQLVRQVWESFLPIQKPSPLTRVKTFCRMRW